MSFADFPTQKFAVDLLQRSIKNGRLGHAYLFSGDDLRELERVAATLAKAVNCTGLLPAGGGDLPNDSCDQCLSCRKVDSGNHPDIHWVRPESKLRIITIDQIRELLSEVHLKPSEARYKVGIIVGADRLKTEAANAFLKTLEEPPGRSILVLLSTEPDRMLETIQSRCLRLHFASGGLRKFTTEEESFVGEFGALAAQKTSGLFARYRLLGSLLTRLAATKAEIERRLGASSPLQMYEDVEPRLREKWEDELAAAVEAEYRRERMELLRLLQLWLRDVWISALEIDGELLAFPQYAGLSKAVAERINADAAAQNLRKLERTQRLLHTNVQEALALEVGFLQLRL